MNPRIVDAEHCPSCGRKGKWTLEPWGQNLTFPSGLSYKLIAGIFFYSSLGLGGGPAEDLLAS
jgi:hypothetical protein